MRRDLNCFSLKGLALALAVFVAAPVVRANVYQWTNTLGGSWFGATNWSPNGVPAGTDVAYITNAGTYTVALVSSASLTMPQFVLGGDSGAQSLVVDGNPTLNLTGWETVAANGALVLSNCWMNGALNIQAGGQMQLLGSSAKVFYSLTVSNQGTILWGGSGYIGGGGGSGTWFYNNGLFQITGDTTIYNGGGGGPIVLVNAGIVSKTAGTGSTSIGMILLNRPGAEVDCSSGTLAFSGVTNQLAGNFVSTAPGKITLNGGTWTDAGSTFSGTGTNTFSSGTFNLRTNPPPGLLFVGGDVYITGTNTFQQSGAITNLAIDGATLRGTNFVADGGTLTFSSGSIVDSLTIRSGGQWVITGTASKLLYGLNALDNQGTVVQSGSVNVSANHLTNNGLWQFTGDYSVSWGGNAAAVFENNGIVRKTGGAGSAYFSVCYFINQPGGLLESLSGTLSLLNSTTNVLGGTFAATAPAKITFSGLNTDAGGICTGTGTNQFVGGTFNLRTNTIPGLQLVGGDVYVTGTNTFQQAGAITNLTLDGSNLRGTNRVGAGTLVANAGSIDGQLAVEAGGQLVLAANWKSLYNLSLLNRGTVLWTGGGLSFGNTVVSNGGLWQISSDDSLGYGGGTTPVWTNSGTLLKSAGAGISTLSGLGFYNQPGGLVQVDAGTLRLPGSNLAGTLRLNGGKLDAAGTFAVAGGALIGSGTFGANAFTGGLLSPGNNGAGLIAFSSGLNLNSNVTFVIEGTSTNAVSGYDRLSVTGAVVLANCNLQVDSLAGVPVGAPLVIIANDGTDAVSGTFNGLPEGALVTAGNLAQFRISYHGGDGNDVVLTALCLPATSRPQINQWTRRGDGNCQLTAAGEPGATYTVLANTNLSTTNWINVGSAAANNLGTLTYADLQSTNFPTRFYRFRLP